MIDRIKLINPFIMAGGMLVLFLLIYLGQISINLVSGTPVDRMDIWLYTFGSCLVYAIFGPIHVMLVSDANRYYNQTVLAFGALLILGILIASLVSGENIFQLPSYRKILVFVVLAFFVFITIAYLIRRLENWSRKNDENFLKSDKWNNNDKD